MIIPKLDQRLLTAAALAKPCNRAVDVGSDHAYLPINLVHMGLCKTAVASDIGVGPLRAAKRNIERAAMSESISTVQTDGLCGLEVPRPDEIFLLGMGGELISRILADAPWLKNADGTRIVMQPMTHPEILRRFLAENGFCTVDEKICLCGGKYYCVLAAEYDGEIRSFSDTELLFGSINLHRRDEMTRTYAEKICRTLRKKANGMKLGGADAPKEDKIADEIEKLFGLTANSQ